MNSKRVICIGLISIGVSIALCGHVAAQANKPAAAAAADNTAQEVHEFQGNVDDLNSRGYSTIMGAVVHDSGGTMTRDTVDVLQLLKSKEVLSYVFLYQSFVSSDAKNAPVYETQRVLEYRVQDGYRYLGSDNNCVAAKYPKLEVIAIGKWTDRPQPRAGGYAHSIKYAWVADPEIKNFRMVSSGSVKCEINADRN